MWYFYPWNCKISGVNFFKCKAPEFFVIFFLKFNSKIEQERGADYHANHRPALAHCSGPVRSWLGQNRKEVCARFALWKTTRASQKIEEKFQVSNLTRSKIPEVLLYWQLFHWCIYWCLVTINIILSSTYFLVKYFCRLTMHNFGSS